jgi:hypothetical protein
MAAKAADISPVKHIEVQLDEAKFNEAVKED